MICSCSVINTALSLLGLCAMKNQLSDVSDVTLVHLRALDAHWQLKF